MLKVHYLIKRYVYLTITRFFGARKNAPREKRPPENYPPEINPPGKLPPGKLPPRKIAPPPLPLKKVFCKASSCYGIS